MLTKSAPNARRRSDDRQTHGRLRGMMRGSAPHPGRGLPQPQSSRRALPCPPLVSVDSYGSLCASRKCPQGTREPPSPCTPLLGLRPKDSRVCRRHSALDLRTHLGLRPKPRASSLARSLTLLEMKLRKVAVTSDASRVFRYAKAPPNTRRRFENPLNYLRVGLLRKAGTPKLLRSTWDGCAGSACTGCWGAASAGFCAVGTCMAWYCWPNSICGIAGC